MGPLLILSCSRSGTTYAAELFSAASLGVEHESLAGPDGAIGWQYAVDTPYSPGHGSRRLRSWGHVVHQVREPLAAIASMQTHTEQLWSFVGRHIDLPASQPARAMAYWLRWNGLIEQQADWRYQVERLTDDSRILQQIAAACGKTLPESITAPPTTTNTRKHERLTWDDLFAADAELTEQVKKMATRYGYE